MKKKFVTCLFLIFLTNYNNIKIDKRVIICGVCKDIGHNLPCMIQIINDITELFEDYRIIVYENNSLDNTKNILSSWVTKDKRILFLSENLSYEYLQNYISNNTIIKETTHHEFSKTELIARALILFLKMQ